MRKSYVVVIALLVLAAILVAVFVIEQRRQTREKQLTTYYGIKLGASKDEVGYALGYPSSVQGPYRPDPAHSDWKLSDEIKVTKSGDAEGATQGPPGGSALTKYDEWHYDFPPDRITIEFDPKTKTATTIYCWPRKEEAASKCKSVLGVGVGISEADVIKALGRPEHQDITGIYKSMKYPNLGLQLMLTKGRVYLIRKSIPVAA